jgi:putative flippase GtrA
LSFRCNERIHREQSRTINALIGNRLRSGTHIRTVIECREFVRFLVTGVTATIGNLSTFWLLRQEHGYNISIASGLVVGMCISFTLSKIFAFRSHSWRKARSEAARFLVIYALGVGIYLLMAMIIGRAILPRFLPQGVAELGGAIAGAASMTITSYLGHRFFTYKTGYPDTDVGGLL